MKKIKKSKKVIIGVLLGVITIIMFTILLIYLNNSKTNYTFMEKKWMNNNKNQVIDISINNNIPVFSKNGEGIIYDYLKEFEIDTKLSFNILTNTTSNYNFDIKMNKDVNNIVMFEDHFVVVSKEYKTINSFKDLKNKKIGVSSNDLSEISGYLENESNIEYKSVENITDLLNSLNNDVDFIILPLNVNFDKIIENKLKVVYHLEGLNIYYSLSLDKNNETLNNIINKFTKKYETKFDKLKNKYYLEEYYKSENLREVEIDNIEKSDLKVGYLDNLPYEGVISKKMSGLNGEYLNKFSDLTNVSFKYIKYRNIKDLEKALSKGSIDLAFNQHNINNENYLRSSDIKSEEYVILSQNNNEIVISSLNSLKNENIFMLKDTLLTENLKSKNIFKVIETEKIKNLFKKREKEDIIITDKFIYDYYKNSLLKNYIVKNIDINESNFNYLLNKKNVAFNNMFNYYIETSSSKKNLYNSVFNSLELLEQRTLIGYIKSHIGYFLILILIIITVLYNVKKRMNTTKKIKKDDKLMYLDTMTNLKNRNFLNDNKELWNNNKIYPQAILIVDLNRVKEINDTEGQDEGDRQIKSAANILIKSQRENTEIMRTDGNEFLIYLVGYEEKQITTYMHKINKELKTLPYDYGAKFGYMMINDEQTTIDDAINDALIKMRENIQK